MMLCNTLEMSRDTVKHNQSLPLWCHMTVYDVTVTSL